MSSRERMGHGPQHANAEDRLDTELQRAYHRVEGVTTDAVFSRLRSRVMHAAVPYLRALRHPRQRTLWEYTAGWASTALPIAMAASLLLGIALVRSSAGSATNASVAAENMSQTDVRTLLYGVFTKAVGVDEAATTLASADVGESQLWEETVR